METVTYFGGVFLMPTDLALYRETTAPRDSWDEIVGIPLDLWIDADTPDKLADLVDRREARRLYPSPMSLADHFHAYPDHETIPILELGQRKPVSVICNACGKGFHRGQFRGPAVDYGEG
jgi:hypothetical protein